MGFVLVLELCILSGIGGGSLLLIHLAQRLTRNGTTGGRGGKGRGVPWFPVAPVTAIRCGIVGEIETSYGLDCGLMVPDLHSFVQSTSNGRD